MKRLLLCICIIPMFILASCSSQKTKDIISSESETSIISSSETQKSTVVAEFTAFNPTYNYKTYSADIKGQSNNGDRITLKIEGTEYETKSVSSDEKFSFNVPLKDNEKTKVSISNSVSNFDYELNSVEDLKRVESNTPAPNKDSEPAQSTSAYSQSTEISVSDTIDVTKKQKETLIAFTQLELDDRALKYKFSGYDDWAVVTHDTTGLKKYIVTTKDKKLGRIKSVYEWNGKDDNGAVLKYLLVDGKEYLNNLK